MFHRVSTPRPVRPGYWFAQKRYGMGSVPATRAGWATTALFVLILALVLKLIPGRPEKYVAAFCLTAIFLAIACLKTDGGWRWRWGGQD